MSDPKPLSTSAFQAEEELFQRQVQEVKSWWKNDRFIAITRPYTAEQVVAKRGTIHEEYPSNIQAKKLWKLISKHAQESTGILYFI
jgi:isocitrate lyase